MLDRLTRRAFLAIAATATSAVAFPAFAQSGDDALAFVRSIYKLKALWSDVEANRGQYLTPEFAAVIDENDKYNRAMDYAVDYDPLGQAPGLGEFKNFHATH